MSVRILRSLPISIRWSHLSVTVDMKLQPNVGSDRSWVWKVVADYAEQPPTAETFAIRFANSDSKHSIHLDPYPLNNLWPDAALFKSGFERGQRINIGLNNGLSSDEAVKAASESQKEETTDTKATGEEEEEETETKGESQDEEKKEAAWFLFSHKVFCNFWNSKCLVEGYIRYHAFLFGNACDLWTKLFRWRLLKPQPPHYELNVPTDIKIQMQF